MLGLHETAGDWNAAVDVLTQLAEIEDNPTRKAKYWCGVATIQQKYLKDRFMAVRSFDHALDADPTMLRAFEAIDQVLTEEKDYERQDRYYRKMLKRAMERQLDDKLIFSIAKNLGEINRSRLKRYDEAAKAYNIALSRRPDDHGTMTILAELYRLDGQTDKAIDQFNTLIKADPKNIEYYRSLKGLYLEANKVDEAWCVAQVLCFLQKASSEDRSFYEKHRSRTLRQVKKELDAESWKALTFSGKSPLMDHLLLRLAPYCVPVMAFTHKDLNINKRKDLVDAGEETPFNTVLTYVSRALRTQQPECFVDPQKRAGLNVLNLHPSAFGLGADLMRGARMQELAFMCAKNLTMVGAQHVLASFDTTYERRKARLLTIVYTLMKLVDPTANVQADNDLLGEFNGSIPQADRAEFSKLIKKMSADPNRHLDLSGWLKALEHTVNRVGFLLANDLESAARVMKVEQGSLSKASVQERVKELILFAISPEYMALRKSLGLSIDGQT